ncbi:hypothetical protein NRK68_28630 [Streptomyces yangpuensis]|uniref:Uncharacterized protein n=1 Tax=Streptomyces yangpuensis TaxID=1648182 RepID=A0ABY5Q3K2_9ACTN|nr:hypothetical protein [Streptomyces yangpuensis]UUY50854.1 hypothetical protein NRK68_28630 [Streptomyces yangpuensis]
MTGPADRARQALASGLPPAEVYAALAVGAGFRDTALAVCDALGIPRADAEHRLRGTEELWGDFAPGDEELAGELLDLAAVFDVHVTLDEPGEQVRRLLGRSMGALGGIGSGAAFSISRKLATGRLPEAYTVLVGLPVRDRGDPARYRAELIAAGELLADWLPPDDQEAAGRVREARERCARRDP